MLAVLVGILTGVMLGGFGNTILEKAESFLF
jgi:hypothetical protein